MATFDWSGIDPSIHNGLALMRYTYATDTWKFLTWGDTWFEQLAPGNYNYQIWMLLGAASPTDPQAVTPVYVASTTVNDTSRLAILGAKK